MSPSKFQDSEVSKGAINGPRPLPLRMAINGPRPLPLRINKHSHLVHKQSSSSSSHQPANGNFGQSPAPKHSTGCGSTKPPVIIYTNSPKVIRANARDFMALVQKLTGMSREDDEKIEKPEPMEMVKDEDSLSDENDRGMKNNVGYGDNETASSALMDERFVGEVKQDPTAVSPMYEVSNTYLVDAPLFNPNSNDIFCSSRPSSLYQYPNTVNSISPSFMDCMKAFLDY